MIKRTIVALMMLVSFIVVPVSLAAPASAHISTCTVAAYNPSKLAGVRSLLGKGRWSCSSVSHHEYVSSKVEIQYWSERVLWSDGWATLARNRQESYRLAGTLYATAPCANGAKRYRTKHTLYMVGEHGVVTKTAYSYGTTINC